MNRKARSAAISRPDQHEASVSSRLPHTNGTTRTGIIAEIADVHKKAGT